MAAFTGDFSLTITDSDRKNSYSQYASNLSQFDEKKVRIVNCNKLFNRYPSFTPVIGFLSVDKSKQGVFSPVNITGANFQFGKDATYVNFGNYTRLPISFFSSSNISFVVPEDASAGTYNVVVVNVYNGNFSPQVNNAYPGILNYSKPVSYTLT